MHELVVQLAELSVAGVRAGEPLANLQGIDGGADFNAWERSFPAIGLKVQYGGRQGAELISYLYLFMRNDTRDWLCRLQGVDHYGATFSAFPGRVLDGDNDRTSDFLGDPESILSACPSLRLLRREKNGVTYVLNGDSLERRIHIEYGADRLLQRVILY